MVCMITAPQIKLSTFVGSGWPQNAVRVILAHQAKTAIVKRCRSPPSTYPLRFYGAARLKLPLAFYKQQDPAKVH